MRLFADTLNQLARRGPYAVVALTALAPIGWFRFGLPIKGVDSYFSLHPAGRVDSSLYAWDSRSSTGGPASDLITVGLNVLQAGAAQLGLPLSIIEATVLTLVSVSATIGMYRLVMHILRSNIDEQTARWIAACACIVWLANPFALSFVWFHQLLIEFTWAALPWLLFIVLACAADNWSFSTICYGLLLVLILGSAGFPHAYLPAVVLLLLIFGAATLGFSNHRLQAARHLSVAAAVFAIGLAWWLIPSLPVIPALVAASTTGQDTARAQLEFVSQFSTVLNVISLTGVPTLYQGVSGTPYVSWSWLVADKPWSALRFTLPALSLIGVAYGISMSRARLIAIPAAVCMAIGVFVSKGWNPPFAGVNLGLTDLPLGDVFRHPLDKFSFILVLPMCMMFAFGLAWLSRKPMTQPIGVLAAGVVCGVLAIPWWTGSVIPTGGGLLPSAYVEVPPSYESVGRDLAASPVSGKTMVLPYSPGGGAAFKWKSGIQPNLDCLLQDWAPDRSMLCRGSGQSYADRVPQALSQAVLQRDPRVLDLAYLWGVDRWLVHEDWSSTYMPTDISPASAMAFLMNPNNLPPGSPAPRHNQAVDFSPASTTVAFFFETPEMPINEDRLLEIGPIDVQINPTNSPQPGVFVAIRDQSHNLWDPGSPVSIGQWHLVVLRFEGGRVVFSVDGTDQGVLNSCSPQTGACNPIGGRGVPLEVLPKSIQIDASPQHTGRITNLTTPVLGQIPRQQFLGGGSNEYVVEATNELGLFGQDSLPPIYAANSISVHADLKSTEAVLQAAHDVMGTPSPVIVPVAVSSGDVDPNAYTSWTRDSPTQYHGALHSGGLSVLVFLQTYDPHWALTVDGRDVTPSSHLLASGFANAWEVHGAGILNWSLTYALQPLVTFGAISGGTLLLIAVVLAIRQYSVQRNRRRRATPADVI